jgi:hypothetical protein
MQEEVVKIVVFVPETHADAVRIAMGEAGCGVIGDYEFCTFSIKGVGRYKPTDKAHPFIGEIGKFEEVAEERIESVCLRKDLDKIIKEIRTVHPYEQPAFDIYPLLVDPSETLKR